VLAKIGTYVQRSRLRELPSPFVLVLAGSKTGGTECTPEYKFDVVDGLGFPFPCSIALAPGTRHLNSKWDPWPVRGKLCAPSRLHTLCGRDICRSVTKRSLS
jgi:hypothetical protein